MSATDALTITSALDALTRYYYAKEREESAVLYINDAYLEAVDALEKLERENANLRKLVQKMMRFFEDGDWCTKCEVEKECDAQEQYEGDCLMRGVFHDRMRELGIEVES